MRAFAFPAVLVAAMSCGCVDEAALSRRCNDQHGCADGLACVAGLCGAPVDAGSADAGREDAGPPVDAGTDDAGLVDAGNDDAGPDDAGPDDAGPNDAGPVDAGFADAGTCIDDDGDRAGDGPDCLAADCDDGDARVFAGHAEECDGIDNDCNGDVDDGDVCGCAALRLGLGDGKDPRLLCFLPRTWADAELECERRGYRLAILHSRPESDALELAIRGQIRGMWIGFSDLAVEGEYAWVDGSPIDFDDFLTGEPNDSGGVEDCGELAPPGWNDDNCTSGSSFICEPAPRPPELGSCSVDLDGDGRGAGCPAGLDCDDGAAGAFALVGGAVDRDGDELSIGHELDCGDGSLPAGLLPAASRDEDCDDSDPSLTLTCPHSSCVTAALPAGDTSVCIDIHSYSLARNSCVSRFGNDLVSIHDAADWDAVGALVLARGIVVGDSAGIEDAWIGLSDIASEGDFVFEDGSSFDLATSFSAFQPGNPNDFNVGEDCVEIQNGGWNDESCSVGNIFVCR